MSFYPLEWMRMPSSHLGSEGYWPWRHQGVLRCQEDGMGGLDLGYGNGDTAEMVV